MSLARLRERITRVSANPADSDDLRLQKTLLVIVAGLSAVAAYLWAAIYSAFGEYVAASIPFIYAVISTLSIVTYAINHRYRFFRFSQLLLILLLPFFLMLVLGGFINSSAVILWSLFSPLGALVFSERRQAKWWFIAYLALVIGSGILQPYVRSENNLSSTVVLIFFVMNIGVISLIAFVVLTYFVGQKDDFMGLLRQEQERSERLLLNILPGEIAETLKTENRVIAEHFDSASIMFADLVGFTPLSAEMAPVEMVELLNDIYSHFDEMVAKYGLEKIRTIGDNYMVASGVPHPRPDHAQALADMALEIRDFLATYKTKKGKPVQFRIGMNSGSLVAGVVGRRKFQYDLWGDAVNIASRMESQGVPGRIQVTAATVDLLRDDFLFERRGTMEIKGKGAMETWFLLGRKKDADGVNDDRV